MLIRYITFTITACLLTFYAAQFYQTRIYMVDLSVILREKAYQLNQQDLKDDALNLAILKAKKKIESYLTRLAK